MSSRRVGERIAAYLLLAGLALAIAASGATVIDWGVAERGSWAYDEIKPADLAGPLGGNAWPVRYPPLHRDLLRAAHALAGRALGLDAAEAAERLRLAWRLNRAPSLLLTVATLWLLYRTARLSSGRLAASLAPAAYAATVQAQYYSRTANLEAHYLFWLAAALFCYQSARRRALETRALAFAACGALAFLAKDQALALFALPAVHLLVERRGAWPADAARGELRSAAGRTRVALIGAAVALALVAIVYRLPAGWSFLQQHVHEIAHGASEPFRVFASSPAGQWAMLRYAARHFVFVMTPGGAALAVAALVAVALDAGRRRRLLPLLWFPISMYVFFIVPIGYHYDRFFLPAAMIAGLLLPALAESLPRQVRPAIAGAAILSVLASSSLPRSLELHRRTRNDSRIQVERLLAASANARHPALILGTSSMVPRGGTYVDNKRARRVPQCALLAEFDWVVLNRFEYGHARDYRRRFRRSLGAGELGFGLHATFELRDSEWLDFGAVYSNLEQIDPAIEIYRRHSSRCTASDAGWLRLDPAAGGSHAPRPKHRTRL